MSRTDAPWIAALAILFALGIGVANGEANHLVYLLPGLHAANPEFLAGDWFVTQVEHPHAAFNTILAGLAGAGALVLGLTVGTFGQSVVLALAVWAIARHLYESPLIPWAMTLLVLGATGTRGVGLSLLIGPQFEASTVAGVATVAGLAMLGTRRYRSYAGAAFGLAALFHAHFAVLLVPVVAVVAVLVVQRDGWLRGSAILVPFLVLGLPSYLQVLAHRADPALSAANDLVLSRFPHHYDPRTWGLLQGILFAGILVAGVAGLLLLRPVRHSLALVAAGVMALMAAVGLVAGYFGLSETLMLAAPWRLGSIVTVFAILAAAAAVVEPRTLAGTHARLVRGGLLLAVAAAIGTAAAGPIPSRVAVAMIASVAAAFLAARLGGGAHPRDPRTRALVLATIVAGFLPTVWHGLNRSHVEIRPARVEQPELYRWILAETPAEAVFAVPPGWIDFRLMAGRSIVADHKSPPTRPGELVTWAARIETLTGLPPRGEAAQLDSAFLAADCDRVKIIREAFDVRFVIRSSRAPACGRAVRSHEAFSVVDVADADTSRASRPESESGPTGSLR
jgi:hypothetical protein